MTGLHCALIGSYCGSWVGMGIACDVIGNYWCKFRQQTAPHDAVHQLQLASALLCLPHQALRPLQSLVHVATRLFCCPPGALQAALRTPRSACTTCRQGIPACLWGLRGHAVHDLFVCVPRQARPWPRSAAGRAHSRPHALHLHHSTVRPTPTHLNATHPACRCALRTAARAIGSPTLAGTRGRCTAWTSREQ